jgi:hypothetical protein
MSARSTKAEFVTAQSSVGLSGWCIDNLHAECSYAQCNCTRCDPSVHHSRAGQAPRIAHMGDPLPWDLLNPTLEVPGVAEP